jgi:hypothetical protein
MVANNRNNRSGWIDHISASRSIHDETGRSIRHKPSKTNLDSFGEFIPLFSFFFTFQK